MSQRQLRTPLSVIVLGMLSEEPLHGYGMRQRIVERAYDRLPGVKTTSLYDAIRRLDRAGLIHADEPDRDGNRPDRTPFAISAAGLKMLITWVEEALIDDTDPDSLPAALCFMYPLGRDRVIALLDDRIDRMARALDLDENLLRRAQSETENPIFLSEHQYQLARRRAEHDWLTGFLTALTSHTLTWPTAGQADH
ncbi:MAG: PadR family transcriptional regulator [Humibacter sp.]